MRLVRSFGTLVFLFLVCVYGLQAKKLRRKNSKCKEKRKLHCSCAKQKDVFGHLEMHPFCTMRDSKASNICTTSSMFTRYSNYKQCIKKDGTACPENDPYCKQTTKTATKKLIEPTKKTLSVSPLVSCTLDDQVRRTNPNHLIPDEKKAFYCDFEANERFSKTDYGDGGTFDNAGLVKFLNTDAALASKMNIKLDECVCADFSGASIQDCNDIFLCDVTCDALIQSKSYEEMCNTDWYMKFCSMKCGHQHIRPRKQISKLDGFDPNAYQFSVETKTSGDSITVYSVGHVVKENIHDASLDDVKDFVNLLAKSIDKKSNGLHSQVHEDWLNANKLQCHTMSDKAIDVINGINSLSEFGQILRDDRGLDVRLRKVGHVLF